MIRSVLIIIIIINLLFLNFMVQTPRPTRFISFKTTTALWQLVRLKCLNLLSTFLGCHACQENKKAPQDLLVRSPNNNKCKKDVRERGVVRDCYLVSAEGQHLQDCPCP